MTGTFASALYQGRVTHMRRLPREHRLDYRIYSVLLDLGELDAIDRRLKLFSVDRFNLFSFSSKDRGDRSGRDLRHQVETVMLSAGVVPDGGAIELLTMPRVLGWAFNPVSIYFCRRKSGAIAAILWEVDNTFGERHGYMIPVDKIVDGEICQQCDKEFFVSPFMDMKLRYVFRVKQEANRLSIVIDTYDGDSLLLTARHSAKRIELTDAALLRAFFALPLQMLGVIVGIHWEALKLCLKGFRLRAHPPPPSNPVTVIPYRVEQSEALKQ